MHTPIPIQISYNRYSTIDMLCARIQDIQRLHEESMAVSENSRNCKLTSFLLFLQNRGLKQKRRSAEQSISDKRKRRKRFSRLQTNPSSALKQRPSRRNIIPPELSNRLPSALREINRRILVQNIMWLGLEREQRRRQSQEQSSTPLDDDSRSGDKASLTENVSADSNIPEKRSRSQQRTGSN